MKKIIAFTVLSIAMYMALACVSVERETAFTGGMDAAPPIRAEAGPRVVYQKGVIVLAENGMGASAFRLPKSLRIIGNEAFTGTAIVSVEFPESVEFIGAHSFAEIATLRSVKIPAGTKTIAGTAFAGSSQVVIFGSSGSYAQAWARENGVPFAPAKTVYAGTGRKRNAPDHSQRQIQIDLADISAEHSVENNAGWRPVYEIKAQRYEEFKAVFILGRAPPFSA